MKLASEGMQRHTSIKTPRQISMMPMTPRAVPEESGLRCVRDVDAVFFFFLLTIVFRDVDIL